MGCGCGKKPGSGVGASRRAAIAPRQSTPRSLSDVRRIQTVVAPAPFSAQRREVERKRRLAIQQALGR